ncbi:MAG: hypothetical protein LBE60_18585 [Microbacterium sp.]|uniref:hypothetical protein n=1 Tax=Microbacterium sp. TaxID=51671 RepID=UPI0028341DF9|nr:hypothetical protein [Microbacterium sp.]MDR2323640.1 hypothetical protein [Microbacterium sp.]
MIKRYLELPKLPFDQPKTGSIGDAIGDKAEIKDENPDQKCLLIGVFVGLTGFEPATP